VSTSADGSDVKFYYNPAGVTAGARPTIGTDVAKNEKSASGSWPIIDIPVWMANSGQAQPSTFYIGLGVVSCSICSKTVDVKVGAFVVWSGPSLTTATLPAALPDVLTPPTMYRWFTARDNSFSVDVAVSTATYGPAAQVAVSGGTNIYCKVSPGLLNTVLVVMSQGSPSTTPNPDQASQTATWKKYPSGTLSQGSLDTGAQFLADGTWYYSVYCKSAGTGSSSCSGNFAIGFGHEPSAAAGLSASFLLVAMSALLALLL